MRYTTLIDLTEWPNLYKSSSVRLVYMHLCLIAGYHDHDRDLTGISLRRLAQDTGLTVSATRCALTRLMSYALIERAGPLIRVKKYVLEEPITTRAKTSKQAKAAAAKNLEDQERAARQKQQQHEDQQRAALRASGKTSYMVWYEEQQLLAAQGNPDAIRNVQTGKATYLAHQTQILKDNGHK